MTRFTTNAAAAMFAFVIMATSFAAVTAVPAQSALAVASVLA